MRIIFLGNPEFALPALHAIHKSAHELAAVVTSPDRPRGRGRKLLPLPVKVAATELGVPVSSPVSLKHPDFLQEMRDLEPDAFVAVAFRILPRELFSIPRLGTLNIHPSLLPKGRGPAPIQWTLLRGETETGVSIIQITEKIDAGGILMQERYAVDPQCNFGDLHDNLAEIGARMIVGVLDRLGKGEHIDGIQQDDLLATKAPKLVPRDHDIQWENPAEQVRNQIRAFSPLPGAFTRLNGELFKVLDAEIVPEDTLSPQELRANGATLYAGTGTTDLRLIRVKPAGKKAMSAEEFLRGFRKLPDQFG